MARAGGFTEIRRIAALTSSRQVRLAPHAWGGGVLSTLRRDALEKFKYLPGPEYEW